MVVMTKMFIIMVALAIFTSAATTASMETGGKTSSTVTVRAQLTCDNYPRVCRTPGSPGPDCCRKQCVNVASDGNNCGRCGRQCGFAEVCCGGSCVNILYDPRHCGFCQNRCSKGSKCKYGMCDYA